MKINLNGIRKVTIEAMETAGLRVTVVEKKGGYSKTLPAGELLELASSGSRFVIAREAYGGCGDGGTPLRDSYSQRMQNYLRKLTIEKYLYWGCICYSLSQLLALIVTKSGIIEIYGTMFFCISTAAFLMCSVIFLFVYLGCNRSMLAKILRVRR